MIWRKNENNVLQDKIVGLPRNVASAGKYVNLNEIDKFTQRTSELFFKVL